MKAYCVLDNLTFLKSFVGEGDFEVTFGFYPDSLSLSAGDSEMEYTLDDSMFLKYSVDDTVYVTVQASDLRDAMENINDDELVRFQVNESDLSIFTELYVRRIEHV